MNFAQLYTSYLSQRPFLNIGLVSTYYLLVVLPHEIIGVWIAKTLDQPFGRETYNLIILAMGISGFLAYLYLVWKGTRTKKDNGKKTWIYLFVTLMLIILSLNTILVVNVELIHFVQYGLLALLIFPLFSTYQETLFWSTILGAIDESYQYLVLAPHRTNYYDFNDVLIDMVGATLGLILLSAYSVSEKTKSLIFYQRSSFKGLLFIIIAVITALAMGWMTIYPSADGSMAYFPLIKKMSTEFWTVIHPNVNFHIVRPFEWVVLTIILWFFYRDIGK